LRETNARGYQIDPDSESEDSEPDPDSESDPDSEPDSDVLRRNKSINGPTNHLTLKRNVHRKTGMATVNRAHSDAVFGSSTLLIR
jgi:hypothetical protein